MNPLKTIGFFLALALAGIGTACAEPPPEASAEIERLIADLGASGCMFQRNGTWYVSSEAQSHLRRKYEWLARRDLVDSAEQFIERAGSRSSMSGKAYQVRCDGKTAVPAAQWLNGRLAELRRSAR